MRLRQRRGTGVNRKAIGAAVFAGVLVAGGLTGLQFASAGEQAKAAEIVVVDGLNFDVAGCEALEINAGAVVCDGAELQPQEQVGAAEAAAASALALEEACDTFATDQAAADAEAAGAEDGAEDAAGAEDGAGEPLTRKAKRAIAEKYAEKIGAADEAGAAGAGAEDEGAGAQDEAGAEAGAEGQAVVDAREALLVACLTLADEKAAAGADAGAGEEAGAGADAEAGEDAGAGAEDEAGALESAAPKKKS